MNIAIVDDSREEQQIIHNAVADWAKKKPPKAQLFGL